MDLSFYTLERNNGRRNLSPLVVRDIDSSVFLNVLVYCAQFDCSTLTDLNAHSSSVCFSKQV